MCRSCTTKHDAQERRHHGRVGYGCMAALVARARPRQYANDFVAIFNSRRRLHFIGGLEGRARAFRMLESPNGTVKLMSRRLRPYGVRVAPGLVKGLLEPRERARDRLGGRAPIAPKGGGGRRDGADFPVLCGRRGLLTHRLAKGGGRRDGAKRRSPWRPPEFPVLWDRLGGRAPNRASTVRRRPPGP
jgi:hypothetical protein